MKDRNLSRQARKAAGLTKAKLKRLLGAKDIVRPLDKDYMRSLTIAVEKSVVAFHRLIHPNHQVPNLDLFIKEKIWAPYEQAQKHRIPENHFCKDSRPGEEAFHAWFKGSVFASYLERPLARMFGVESVEFVGLDNVYRPETFARDTSADYRIPSEDRPYVEVQTGFANHHDVKQTKIARAQKTLEEEGRRTFLLHVDALEQSGALIRDLGGFSKKRTTRRSQMEGKRVVPLKDVHFNWSLLRAGVPCASRVRGA